MQRLTGLVVKRMQVLSSTACKATLCTSIQRLAYQHRQTLPVSSRPFNLQVCHFSIQPPSTTNVDSFPEQTFHKISDHTLEELSDALGQLDSELEDVDINLSQGVLSVNLGPDFNNKTWVINKQTPNRQIWWSSPISGPRRYEYVGDKNGLGKKDDKPASFHWRFSRNETSDLWGDLKKEIKEVTKVDIEIP